MLGCLSFFFHFFRGHFFCLVWDSLGLLCLGASPILGVNWCFYFLVKIASEHQLVVFHAGAILF